MWQGFRCRNSIRAYSYSLRSSRLRVQEKFINAIAVMSMKGVEDVYLL